MKGEDIDTYVVEFEELVRMTGYQFDIPQMIETFMDGLPTGLYQKMYEFDQPVTYEQWKQAVVNHQQQYIHMKDRLNTHRGRFTPTLRPHQGWAPCGPLTDPNAMDTLAGRSRGRITRSEEMNPHTMP